MESPPPPPPGCWHGVELMLPAELPFHRWGSWGMEGASTRYHPVVRGSPETGPQAAGPQNPSAFQPKLLTQETPKKHIILTRHFMAWMLPPPPGQWLLHPEPWPARPRGWVITPLCVHRCGSGPHSAGATPKRGRAEWGAARRESRRERRCLLPGEHSCLHTFLQKTWENWTKTSGKGEVFTRFSLSALPLQKE